MFTFFSLPSSVTMVPQYTTRPLGGTVRKNKRFMGGGSGETTPIEEIKSGATPNRTHTYTANIYELPV